MAVIPATLYPDQTVTGDPAYPLGKAQNDLTLDDGTGTPLEQRWLNDIWGFLQALLAEAGITATGTPDQIGASQYLQALKAIALLRGGAQTLSSPLVLNGQSVTVGLGLQVNGALGLAAGAVVAGGILLDNLIASGNAQFQTAQIANLLTFSGAGHMRGRRVLGADSAGQSYGVNTADTVVFNTLTANRTCSLLNTSAGIGSRIRFYARAGAGAFYMQVLAATGTANCSISSTVSGFPQGAEFEHNGTDWELAYYGALHP